MTVNRGQVDRDELGANGGVASGAIITHVTGESPLFSPAPFFGHKVGERRAEASKRATGAPELYKVTEEGIILAGTTY